MYFGTLLGKGFLSQPCTKYGPRPARAFLVARESFLNCGKAMLQKPGFGYNQLLFQNDFWTSVQ